MSPKKIHTLIPFAAAAALCMAAASLPFFRESGVSPLTLAIVLGMAAGNSPLNRHTAALGDAVLFAKGTLLRLGIVFYGFRITVPQLLYAGWPALLADVCVVAGTFVLALYLGRRLRLDADTAALVGAGSAICGAAAVLAAQPVLKAKEADVGVAVATVVVFGTLAMFVYPLMAAALLPHDAPAAAWFGWGIYTGATVHEVAQVAAAGAAVNPVTADVAVITKMIRVLLLAPFLLLLPRLMRRFNGSTDAGGSGASVPWFALGFIAAAVFNSFIPLPAALHGGILQADTFLLTLAMCALGFSTRWQRVHQAGMRPLLLAALLAIWLLIGGGAISYAACRLFV